VALVTLVSGGIDSVVMSVMAREENIELYPLFVDYGQLGAGNEWTACRLLHTRHELPKPVRMDLCGFGGTIPSGITSRGMRINEDAFLPGRNLLLILAGAGYAYRVQANGVAIGLLSPTDRLFPDQTEEFLGQCESLMALAMGRRFSIVAPLLGFGKKDVLAMARARGIKDTYSCHAGGATPCGRCVACMEIRNAKRRR
jgi:7-cyano-7-deazaguanine synthase